ncbi:MAG TPA: ATP-binding protein [Patescibacteria group bacterium]|nr:ATP-binding protein [Patescibacteria group bacterium]
MLFPAYIRIAVLLITMVSTILLASLVYKREVKSATNTIFTILSLVTCGWLLAIYISSEPLFATSYLWWSRITILLAVPQSVSFFLLAHTIPATQLGIKKYWLYLIIVLTGAVMALTVSPYVFEGVELVHNAQQLIPGKGMPVFVGFVTLFSISAIVVLFRKIYRSQGVERQQLRFMLTGILLMLGFIIATIMIPVVFFENSAFLPFAPLYALIFLVMTAVAILKYHLFNIKLIATEALITILMLILLFEGLLSGSLITIIFKTSFAILVGIIGILLLRSVKKEVQQRQELAELATSLEKANLSLQELDRQKTDFLSIAAHQLRTPLSIINGYVELIREGAYGKVQKKTVEILDNMDKSNGHLVKLVDEFLDITRIEQGRTKFALKSSSLTSIIDGVVQELAGSAKQKELKILWKKPSEAYTVLCDDEKIRHVVFNFIDNAIKYSEKDGITIGVAREEGGVAVRVSDHGIGFDKTDEVNLFQKFYRGSNVKGTNVNGTGLGLYVCKKFVEGHTGRIWAKSAGLGKGSEFGFWIPNKSS